MFDVLPTMSEQAEPDLAEPGQSIVAGARWKPNRAGIHNIWEYDNQVFEFADGRLVLRGPNGSGKSNALALLVPFLLDGVMASNRMDSLSGGRSMKTLLLCLADDERANRFRHERRTGYVWLEFRRADEYVAIGCGARASVERDAEAWFFVTPRRPGIDLDLIPGGVPRSKGGLAEDIGATAVYDSAETYRTAVDRTLFGMGRHRYNNLLELLLVLRRPHLAGKLNLEHLSKVLSDGLPALDDQLIVDVAASFEDLEAVQRDLRQLLDAHRTVQSFLPTYKQYLRATAHARAHAATEAERELRAARRRVADAEKGIAKAESDVEQVREARISCEKQREVAEQRHRAVLESPAYRDALSLVEVENRAKDAESGVAQAEERLVLAQGETDQAANDAENAEAGVREATSRVDRAFTSAGEAADHAGIRWGIDISEIESAQFRQTLRAIALERRGDIADVRKALAEMEAATIEATAKGESAARSAKAAARAEADREAAAVATDAQRAALDNAVRDWMRKSDLPGLDVVYKAVEHASVPSMPSLSDVLADALRPRRDELAARDARSIDLSRMLLEQRDSLQAERQRVATDPVPSPDRVSTRPATREGRIGAPLYACCDFSDQVTAADRAGLEAAIEAAGLLDAWVGEADGTLDAWLEPVHPFSLAQSQPVQSQPVQSQPVQSQPVQSPSSSSPQPLPVQSSSSSSPVPLPQSLADVLVPTPPHGSHLTPEDVRSVLASITLAKAGIAVLPDGSFHLGPLSGRFAKPAAEFIGATAREQRRQRLLAELDARLAELALELREVEEELAAISAKRSRLEAISASLPSTAALMDARDLLLGAIATAKSTSESAASDEAQARDARQAAEGYLSRLHSMAHERHLPATVDGLDHTDQSVHAYEQRAGALMNAAAILVERRTGRATARARLIRAQTALESSRKEHEDLTRRATGLRARVEQLRTQLGAKVDEPLAELESIEAELRDLRDDNE
ncbi:MAG: hypothetical protein ACYDGY_06485, partial [Acidimicrobiales bacterium]